MDSLKSFFRPEVIWFLIGLILLLAELATPGLVIFFFGVGAWITAVICLGVNIGINAQIAIFTAASLVLLIALRHWLKSIFTGHIKSEQGGSELMEEFVGERAVVKTAITTQMPGKIEIHGTDWLAQADKDIPAGTVVKITEKDNLTLKVEPL